MKIAYVVDDNLNYQKLIQDQLCELGFDVKSFFSIKECIPQLKQRPSLIVLDQSLGEDEHSKGYLKAFKKRALGIPIVLLSAVGEEFSATKLMKLGVFDHIEKNGSAMVRLRTAIDNIPQYLLKERKKTWAKILAAMAILVITAVSLIVVMN